MQIIKHNGINYICDYYPCHEDLQDCTFCYCPFYPCGNTYLGKMLEKEIWDCTNCTWIHQIKTVEQIYDRIDCGRDYSVGSENFDLG